MNIAEILRKLADIADSGASGNNQEPQNVARLSTASAGLPIDNPENQDAGEGDPVMVPPLQLKTELLKRAVGVDNIYDPGEPRADQTHDHGEDEVAIMKRRAGIPVAAVMELSNQEITDD